MRGGYILNKIKVLRENLKISQTKIAEILGVKQSAVSQWETGETIPRADKLPELAKILGCTIDDLFKNEEKGA